VVSGDDSQRREGKRSNLSNGPADQVRNSFVPVKKSRTPKIFHAIVTCAKPSAFPAIFFRLFLEAVFCLSGWWWILPKLPERRTLREVDGVAIPFASRALLWRMKAVRHREKDAPDLWFLRQWFASRGQNPPPV
jgi:hypothetical protein